MDESSLNPGILLYILLVCYTRKGSLECPSCWCSQRRNKMHGRWSQGTKVMGATLIFRCHRTGWMVLFSLIQTLQSDYIHMLLAYVSTFWMIHWNRRYSRLLFQNYTKRVDRSVLRQYILCCKDVSCPAQLCVWIQVTFSHICKIMHCIQLELLLSLMMLAYSVK